MDGPDLPLPGHERGLIVHGLNDEERSAAYAADITYGTNNEFGFDYLRDNMKYALNAMTQRGHAFAIVDEVDSILVDEARTPLIISGPTDDQTEYRAVDALMGALDQGRLRPGRKNPPGVADRTGQRAYGPAAQGSRSSAPWRSLRHREHHRRPSCQPGAEGASAVPEGQGLHRQERPGDHHRRIHRPHDGRPPLFRRPAPGAGSQGAGRQSSPKM